MMLQKMRLLIGLLGLMLPEMCRGGGVGCSSTGCAFVPSQTTQLKSRVKSDAGTVSLTRKSEISATSILTRQPKPFYKYSTSDSSTSGSLFMSSEIFDNENDNAVAPPKEEETGELTGPMVEDQKPTWVENVVRFFQRGGSLTKPPPFDVEDTNLLFYDVFLILNLSLSISFWVVHRMSFDYIGSAIGEGSLLCILWIVAGLYHGAFLDSAVDGHYGSSDERGGPKAAGLLGLQTFIGTVNLRICFALLMAVLEHRPVGVEAGEQMMPLEIVFGLVLMSMWRALHSSYAPRI